MHNASYFNKYLKKKIIRFAFHDHFSYSSLRQITRLYFNVVRNERLRKRNQVKYEVPIPPLCIFSVTWNCNLSCKGCYAMNYKKSDTLKVNEIEATFTNLLHYGTYVFILAGGEPLTIKELISTIEKCNRGIYFLFTNGLLINNKIAEVLRKCPHIIPVISIEGETYHTDERRGETVAGQLQNVFQLLRDCHIAFGISSMATHQNYQYLTSYEYAESVRKMGASFLYIIDYIPFNFSLNEEFILTKEDYRYKKTELHKRSKDTPLTIFNFPAEEYADGVCEAGGKGFLHINAHGYVEPCPFCHYAEDKITEKDYIGILKSDFLSGIRKMVKEIDNKDGNCLLFENREMVKRIASETGAISTETG